ncbi:MAG TPA: hypothetical protein VGQ62_01750, partial [Chloroflexota bacterium]|nr:hypothetical protein [Chloroflexota bacterium]
MPRCLHLILGFCLLAVAACSSAQPAPPTATAGPPATSVAARPAASSQPSPSAAASPSALAALKLPATDPAVHVFLWGNAATTARDLQLAHDG